MLSAKVGRPSKDSSDSKSQNTNCLRPTRDSTFSKHECVLCQTHIDGEALHEVFSESITNKLKFIAQNSDNEKVKCRLSLLLTTEDKLAGMTYDMKYHLPCLVKCHRNCKATETIADDTCTSQIFSDLELVDWVSRTLNNGEKNMSMNDVQETYFEILVDNLIAINPDKRYKPYLKSIIQANITNVVFQRPTDVTKSEQLLSTGEVRRIVSLTLKDKSSDDLVTLMAAAKILRRDSIDYTTWVFTGSFDDYADPKLLLWFCNYLIHGPSKIKNDQKKKIAKKNASVIAQHIVQSFRSDRQMKQGGEHFRRVRETPLSVGSSLFARLKFRSKLLNKFLFDINIGVSNDKIIEIEDSVAEIVHVSM